MESACCAWNTTVTSATFFLMHRSSRSICPFGVSYVLSQRSVCHRTSSGNGPAPLSNSSTTRFRRSLFIPANHSYPPTMSSTLALCFAFSYPLAIDPVRDGWTGRGLARGLTTWCMSPFSSKERRSPLTRRAWRDPARSMRRTVNAWWLKSCPTVVGRDREARGRSRLAGGGGRRLCSIFCPALCLSIVEYRRVRDRQHVSIVRFPAREFPHQWIPHRWHPTGFDSAVAFVPYIASKTVQPLLMCTFPLMRPKRSKPLVSVDTTPAGTHSLGLGPPSDFEMFFFSPMVLNNAMKW